VCFELRTLRSDASGDLGAAPAGLCALKCGHVFCLPCIDSWYGGRANATCPQCNQQSRRDAAWPLRVHAAAAVIACRAARTIERTDGGHRRSSGLDAERAAKRFRVITVDTALVEKAQRACEAARLAHATAASQCSRVKFERAGRQQDLELLLAEGARRLHRERERRAARAPGLTEAQKQRAEANRAAAIERRHHRARVEGGVGAR
jgi:hypothetical protein